MANIVKKTRVPFNLIREDYLDGYVENELRILSRAL
jgi:hypothetical protein